MSQQTIRTKIDQLKRFDPRIMVELGPSEEAVSRIQGRLSGPLDTARLKEKPHLYARKAFDDNRELFAEMDERVELADGRACVDRLGMTHVALEQKYGEATVMGACVSVHFKADGSLYLLQSSLVHKIDAEAAPAIDAKRALQIALDNAGRTAVAIDRMPPKLVVASGELLHQNRAAHHYYLCWRVLVDQPLPGTPANWVYYIDASEGRILFRYNGLISTSATGYHSAGTHFHSAHAGADHITRDDNTTAGWAAPTKPKVHTYDNAGSYSETGTTYRTDADDIWGEEHLPPREADERAVVDVHRYLGYALDYFYATHGHNSWDNAGADLIGVAHYGVNYLNAAWTPGHKRILVGDGDGVNRDFYSAFDVLLHEFTHGVVDGFGLLIDYDSEIGALNEGLADSFAALASLSYPAEDTQPWVNGEKKNLTVPARNLADPSRDAAGVLRYDSSSEATKLSSCYQGYYPDHYSIRYLGAEDNHGVHFNAPIIGHAIYLMTNGGTHRLSSIVVTGIGASPVEQMLYYTISTPGSLSATSVFADFRQAMITACQTLFPDNLDYLVTVKNAFKAVGIGADLYVRDTPSDVGLEPGTLSCMSPDIISRVSVADAATLAQIADVSNSSLCQWIELNSDNYVYFRIFNGGSSTAAGTFRLFLSPSTTFGSPATWHEVGHYDFPAVPAGGVWVPTAATEYITLPAALTTTLGTGHFCFIGVIESSSDPAPDRTQIHSESEFHDFIRMSNNFAWRNCDIEDHVLPTEGEMAPIMKQFVVTGFERRQQPVELEIDATNLPRGTRLQIFLPKAQAGYLKFFGVQSTPERPETVRTARIPLPIPRFKQKLVAQPLPDFRVAPEQMVLAPRQPVGFHAGEFTPFEPQARAVTRITGMHLGPGEEMKVHFAIRFPANVGSRDVHLAFRQSQHGEHLGQMNYIFRLRKRK